MNRPRRESTYGRGEPVLLRMADVQPQRVEWLWPGRMPLGRITVLAGPAGAGKSFVTTDAAARITTGTPWPDGSACKAGSVLLMTAEDDPADTVRPRLDAHGADVARVHLLPEIRHADGSTRLVTLLDVAAIRTALGELADCRLVVLDPIGSYLAGGVDAHRDNVVRNALGPLAKMATECGVAVVLVAHPPKAGAIVADDLVLGSRAFTALARSVQHVFLDPDNEERRLLLPGKSNLARKPTGLAFTISGDPARVIWEPEPVTIRADDLAAMQCAASRRGPAPVQREAAEAWLAALLECGPVLVPEIKARAKAVGYKWRTVERAKADLRIVESREGFGAPVYWELPHDQSRQVSLEEKNLASMEETWRECEKPRENGGSNITEPAQSRQSRQVSGVGEYGLAPADLDAINAELAAEAQEENEAPRNGRARGAAAWGYP